MAIGQKGGRTNCRLIGRPEDRTTHIHSTKYAITGPKVTENDAHLQRGAICEPVWQTGERSSTARHRSVRKTKDVQVSRQSIAHMASDRRGIDYRQIYWTDELIRPSSIIHHPSPASTPTVCHIKMREIPGRMFRVTLGRDTGIRIRQRGEQATRFNQQTTQSILRKGKNILQVARMGFSFVNVRG